MSLSVGDVIYLIDPTSKSVVPAQVNEQIVTRKLDGEFITHKVKFTSGKTGVLEDLDASYYSSLDDVRSQLMKRAEALIDQGIELARKAASENFSNQAAPIIQKIENNTHSPEDIPENLDNKVQVVLPDGKVANVNVNIPEEFTNENLGT